MSREVDQIFAIPKQFSRIWLESCDHLINNFPISSTENKSEMIKVWLGANRQQTNISTNGHQSWRNIKTISISTSLYNTIFTWLAHGIRHLRGFNRKSMRPTSDTPTVPSCIYIYTRWDSLCYRRVSHHASMALTHCGLVTPYGGRDLGQHWFRPMRWITH